MNSSYDRSKLYTMLNLQKGKCYEIQFGNYYGNMKEKMKIVGDKTIHGEFSHSYPSISPSNKGWKKGWTNYFMYIWDHGIRKNTYGINKDMVSVRELLNTELLEFENLIKKGNPEKNGKESGDRMAC